MKPDCISIDYEVDPKWIKDKINGIPIQGGLDPKVLLSDKEKIVFFIHTVSIKKIMI